MSISSISALLVGNWGLLMNHLVARYVILQRLWAAILSNSLTEGYMSLSLGEGFFFSLLDASLKLFHFASSIFLDSADG